MMARLMGTLVQPQKAAQRKTDGSSRSGIDSDGRADGASGTDREGSAIESSSGTSDTNGSPGNAVGTPAGSAADGKFKLGTTRDGRASGRPAISVTRGRSASSLGRSDGSATEGTLRFGKATDGSVSESSPGTSDTKGSPGSPIGSPDGKKTDGTGIDGRTGNTGSSPAGIPDGSSGPFSGAGLLGNPSEGSADISGSDAGSCRLGKVTDGSAGISESGFEGNSGTFGSSGSLLGSSDGNTTGGTPIDGKLGEPGTPAEGRPGTPAATSEARASRPGSADWRSISGNVVTSGSVGEGTLRTGSDRDGKFVTSGTFREGTSGSVGASGSAKEGTARVGNSGIFGNDPC
ncbi:hypothetical protein HBI18_251160 [Parastagonospora nodorum]|nr:hypothetical protein HBI18_251160 [Parastagonospora nodorum]